ncbi:hypothetical protein H8356DRAFT_1419407 [Neocallimastix lanati (nom. inval.)]|nr:hypothetical protein H8356DRAFT_1419407 [Neocallimastix sp. JGI-2020a]
MTKEYFSESDINFICNKIYNPFSNEIVHFKKSPNFKPEEFVKMVINHINSHKVAANTHVGILAAQSIGEPVTQLALSCFHKLAGDDTINGLKELVVDEFYLKPEIMMKIQKIEFLNSFKYINLKDIVLDIVYDGFNLPIKQYLKDSNSILGNNGIEYVVEEDILCAYKVKENCPNNIIYLESDDEYDDKYVLSDNEQNKNE